MNFIKTKLIIISAILIFFISLTSINAADIDDLSNGNNNDYLKNSNDAGNFTTLFDDINSTTQTTVILTKDYIYDSQKDSSFANGINITMDNLIIDGQNHTIDANNSARAFNIKSNNVILKNINIINGHSSTDGGSVCFSGTNGTIINSTFKYCNSPKYGGAVSFKGTGTVMTSYFENNTAGTGGAVDFENTGNIVDSTFKGNYAKFQGGAVSFYGISNVMNSTFIKNTGGDGGTIYSESECSVDNSTFLQNTAIGYGGGIYFMTYGSVNNSIFTENTAYQEGSAIIIKSNDLKILNSQFNFNSADKGYSLYILSKSTQLENLTFYNENCQFNSEIYIESDQFSSNKLSFINKSKTTPSGNDNQQKIIKKKTVIKCSSKTFKAKKKTKKYTVQLKSGNKILKGKKIKLILKGKAYYKKTNRYGKAIFKIKLNKKGRYKARIKFYGDKYYKSSKKAAIIKIK